MELLANEEFLAWARTHEIAPDAAFSSAPPLTFLGSVVEREWQPPSVPGDLEGFISTMVRAASQAGPYWLYLPGGAPWLEPDPGPLTDQNRNRIMAMVGVPATFRGALGFDIEEWRDILLIVLAYYLFGWNVYGDIQIVPAQGGVVLQTSHHGPMRVRCASELRMTEMIATLKLKRFEVDPRPA